MLCVLHAQQDSNFARGFDAVKPSGSFDAFEPVVVTREKRVIAGEKLQRFEISVSAASADSDMEDVDAGLFERRVIVGSEIFRIPQHFHHADGTDPEWREHVDDGGAL